MIKLTNPASPGIFEVDEVIYASSGLDYASVPQLTQFRIYAAPHSDYITSHVDISAFGELGAAVPWPFDKQSVPLNGHIRIPRGQGPFPLAVFAHGNHNAVENSTPGYLYLCDMLASQGIIAVSIDVNFLNGFNFGENDARAIVHLEHLKQFRTWSDTPGHPLNSKINRDRLMIVGHSRGGEGVGHASAFNRLDEIQPDQFSPVVKLDGSAGLGPYYFHLSLVAAIAPTDNQYQPITGPVLVPDNYFLIHGSRDGDVSSFEGYNTYNRAHAVDLADPTVSRGQFKALLWVYFANHNQFNSTWQPETSGSPVLTRAKQEQVAKVQFGALAAAVLQDQSEYFEVLKDHGVVSSWMPPGAIFVSQYQDPQRIFLMHNQESLGVPQISSPVRGTTISDSVSTSRQFFDLVRSGRPQRTITLQLLWNSLGSRFFLELDPATVNAENYPMLSLQVGQSTETGNMADRYQDFTLEVSSGSRTAAIRASSLQRLPYPDRNKTVMQTLRLPMRQLRNLGVDPRDLRSIALVFDQRPSGVLYIGDVQICN